MNKIISTLIIAITVMALTSCNSGHSSKQDEVTTSEKQDSIRQANAEADSIKKAQEEQARLEADSMKKVQEEQARLEAEREAKKWKGATSRSDLKSKLNGTTWETTSPYSVTGLHYQFKINGNSVTMRSSLPTRNYDDEKEWGEPFNMTIDDIAEPKKGLYCVICKAIDENDARGAVPTILVFQDETVIYSLGGDKGPNLKKID